MKDLQGTLQVPSCPLRVPRSQAKPQCAKHLRAPSLIRALAPSDLWKGKLRSTEGLETALCSNMERAGGFWGILRTLSLFDVRLVRRTG